MNVVVRVSKLILHPLVRIELELSESASHLSTGVVGATVRDGRLLRSATEAPSRENSSEVWGDLKPAPIPLTLGAT